MATKSENSEIAVLQTQMEELSTTLAEMKHDIKDIKIALDERYVTKHEFAQFKSNRWIALIVTVLVTAALTALVEFFFAHVNLAQDSNTRSNGTTTTTTTNSNPNGTPATGAQSTSTSTSTAPSPSPSASTPSGGGVSVPLPVTTPLTK